MNRREFVKRNIGSVLIAVVGTIAFGLTGCSAVTDLENWIPIAQSAVDAIVKLLGPSVPPQVTAAIALIDAALTAVLTAIKNYKSGSGVLADITNAIAAVESAFQSFFVSLHIPSALLGTIEALAQIILSTIAAFANEINPKPAPAATMTVGGHAVTITPVKRSIGKFKSDWNKECVASNHPEVELK